MKKQKRRNWKREERGGSSPKPEFYLTEKEKKDGQSSQIQRWLDLADCLFEIDSADTDPTPSTA